MKHWIAKASALVALTLCLMSPGLAQDQKNQKDQKGKGGQTTLDQQKPGEKGAEGGPVVSKEEDAAYKVVYDARVGDPKHLIEVGEGFLAKYPMSIYAGAVYSELTTAYLNAGQEDKFLEAG